MTGEKRGADRPPEGPAARGTGAGSGAAFAGLGLQFALAIVVFLYAGQWLDRRLGTGPLFLILGVFVGAGGAFYSMYRKLMAAQRREEEEARRGREP
jgi:F0F1-type ATP synthase assembly protein I